MKPALWGDHNKVSLKEASVFIFPSVGLIVKPASIHPFQTHFKYADAEY